MPIEVSVVQLISLGMLIAWSIFLFVLLLVCLYFARKLMKFVARFQGVGADRVDGRIQVRGLFGDKIAPKSKSRAKKPRGKPGGIAANLKKAFDFSPSEEDLARAANVEDMPNGAPRRAN